ncbi:MAG: hypothetical protein KAV98_04365 [Dehalococcoidia bacterium]|nr:hypothetical protein [Dehalococcoidia bacterium]
MPASILPFLLSEVETPTEPKVLSFSVRARWLYDGDCRLDASFHADEVVRARRAIEDSGFKVKLLGKPDVTREIFNLPRFKRIYTDDPRKGWPYLSASEAFMFRPKSNRWIARDKAPAQAEHHFAKAGWILVTCSGVVGRCVLVAKRLETYFLTHDLLRIVPVLPAGYLYAFLSTWMGQTLMVKEQYGGTITHLEPHHLQGIPVPLLLENEQQAIHEQIMKAYRLRDEANDLLDQANELLHRELGVPRFDESQVPYLGGVKTPKAFVVKASELAERLDASFHLPVAKAAVQQLREGKYPLVRLGDVAQHIYIPPRFKRIYVAPEYGVPFLQGSHIPLMKPYNLKYLSRRAHANLSPWIIREGWVLVTCSGTIGRVALVPKRMDGWAASQHIERIIPNLGRIHAGYVAAFLMTPYGQHQLTSKIYGGVVDELTEDDTAAVCLPDAPWDVQRRIGNLMLQAFEKREEANQIEGQAISTLEKTITKSR